VVWGTLDDDAEKISFPYWRPRVLEVDDNVHYRNPTFNRLLSFLNLQRCLISYEIIVLCCTLVLIHVLFG
jgi:hypothetical protein